MEHIYSNEITLATGTPALATNVPLRATKIHVEPKVGNAGVSSIVDAASAVVIRQFPATASVPVNFPFYHKNDNNQINPLDYKFAGTTGDKVLVTFWEQ